MNKRAFIPISALLGALLLALVAAMTPFVADPERAHAQAAASITVGGQAVSGFALGTYDYTANPIRVSSGTTHISVSASAVSGSRVHSIRYATDITASTSEGDVAAAALATLPGAAAPGGNVPLRANESTDIGVVMVTGTGDAATGTTYVVTVTRVSSSANDNANLAEATGLAVAGVPSGTTLVPDFDPDTTSYSLFVPYDVDDSGGDATDDNHRNADASRRRYTNDYGRCIVHNNLRTRMTSLLKVVALTRWSWRKARMSSPYRWKLRM